MQWLKKLLGKLIAPSKQEQTENSGNQENNIKQENSSNMGKTVITKVVDQLPEGALFALPQNRTLYADHFTDDAFITEEGRAPWNNEGKSMSMKDVFEHYQPKKDGVELSDEDGGTIYEDFEFKQIKDFEDDQLIAQSEYLKGQKSQIDAYNSVIMQLEKNKTLRNALKDADARANMKKALMALLSEIENTE